MKKIFLSLLCLLCVSNAYAMPLLNFKAGQKASYTIIQEAMGEVTSPKGVMKAHMGANIHFNLEVISVDPKTGSYPIEVVVTLKKVAINDRFTVPFGNKQITYDSSRRGNNPLLKQALKQLIDQSLRFIVHEDFELVELTGKLQKFEVQYSAITDMYMFGGSEFSYRMILGQIFHLAGAQAGQNSYPIAAYPLANWEEEVSSSADEVKIADTSHYQILATRGQKLHGVWKGQSRVLCKYTELQDLISIQGNVIWDKDNPLLQSRDIVFKLRGKDLTTPSLRSSATIHQKWTAYAP